MTAGDRVLVKCIRFARNHAREHWRPARIIQVCGKTKLVKYLDGKSELHWLHEGIEVRR